ncbi:MAG: UDP-N-acetylmuramoylalanine--D-glutamate ligase [Eubacteriales bacterium SKADARSKE-1]|nr:UDP-N-acetylmuramoylalanine--D-glutamate ligase [Eubacteriales bacterium SKADARSKE-1]
MNTYTDKFFKNIYGKKVAFLGIGKSNMPLIKMFHQKGAKVIACDRSNREKILNEALELESLGVELRLGESYLENLDVDIIFRTPGMRFSIPELNKAHKNGIVVTSEMEIFFELCPCKIIGITGSDGKTTTTSIISEILKHSGKTVHLGGNIGTPLLSRIENIKEDDIAVVELSSFQLISMRKSPDIAVVTNLEPNHLDMHKDMAEYIDAKKNILLHQNAFSKTVLNLDNEITSKFSDSCRGQTLFFSTKKECENGAFVDVDTIYMSIKGKKTPIMKTSDIKIPGKHNVENYLAAICAVFGLVSIEDIIWTAKNFAGVEHRTEFVREKNGVKYFNDSIASSPTRTISGTLSLHDNKIILIAGGYDKKIPFDKLGPVISNKVKLLILMGQTANKIETAVRNSSAYEKNNPKIVTVKNMEEAVNAAYRSAVSGDIVSLSPACASFGLYKNFEERGKHFKKLVNEL